MRGAARRWVVGIVRAALRLLRLLAITGFYYCQLLGVDMLARLFPEGFESKRRPVAQAWLRQLQKGMGQRTAAFGPVPEGQVFLVINHVTWQDIFVLNAVPQLRAIAMDAMRDMPILGRFFRALDCVFVNRQSAEVERINAEIRLRLERGESILLAPESVISPGRHIQRFRAALLESAVREGFPVHYGAIHYQTPHGWPPPSKTVLFGPDPYVRTPEGKIPQSQLDMWGPPRFFLPYFLKLLCLPWYRCTLTFGEAPIVRDERIELAQALHAAVSEVFHPID
jgi:1-acyl-sn-glycerol-3-phosphate acyltransferase